jgi:hypothetical protein
VCARARVVLYIHTENTHDDIYILLYIILLVLCAAAARRCVRPHIGAGS